MSPSVILGATRAAGLLLLPMLAATTGAVAQDAWMPPVPTGPFTPGLHAFGYITPDGSRDTADVGAFRVPVHYGGSSSDSLLLVFVRLRSRAAQPAPPLVYLAGGPGSSAIDLSQFQQMRFFEDMRSAGDVILLDQRGTGRSEPVSRCEGNWDMGAERALNDPALIRSVVAQGKRCADALRARGVELSALTTLHIADDVEMLRRSLGVPRVNLFGFSSGSHFALEFVRRHPSSVARIIIGGVEGPGQTYKLPVNAAPVMHRLDSVVKAHPPLGGRVPSFMALVDSVHQRLRRQPITVRLPIRTVLRAKQRPWWQRTGIAALALMRPHYSVMIHEPDLQAMLAVGLGRMDVLRELPALYRSMNDGNYERAALFLLVLRKTQPIGQAMTWIVDCADGVTRARADSIARQSDATVLGRMINFPFPHVCDGWKPVPDPGDGSRQPVSSDVPALLAVGTLDGRTSLEQTKEVLRTLPNGTLITVINAAHGDVTIFNAPEVRAATLQFLRGEPVRLAELRLPAPTFAPTAAPKASLTDTLVAEGVRSGPLALLRRYEALRAMHASDGVYDFSEPALNSVGYRLISLDAVDAAVAAFRRNVELFPRSLNVYDSLGEGLIAAQRWADAAACLDVAISLGYNPHSYRLKWKLPAKTEWPTPASESVCLDPPWQEPP